MAQGRFRTRIWTRLAAAPLAAALLAPPVCAEERSDLREFRIGMRVEDLPRSGYQGFGCAAAPAETLSGWQDYARCPADASGLHDVRFRYDQSANPLALIDDDYEGTKVGGHPMLLSLLISGGGRVEGIRMETDPQARLYLRKKAFLFGPQAMQRYGPEGWSCAQRPPDQGEQPVGGVFIKEHCEKTTAARHFILERALLRRPGQDRRDFVSLTRLTILSTDPARGR